VIRHCNGAIQIVRPGITNQSIRRLNTTCAGHAGCSEALKLRTAAAKLASFCQIKHPLDLEGISYLSSRGVDAVSGQLFFGNRTEMFNSMMRFRLRKGAFVSPRLHPRPGAHGKSVDQVSE
jgi:hypothetical protein